MNANELRIGNLLQLNPKKQWFGLCNDLTIVVESICDNGINYTNFHENRINVATS